MYNLLKMIKLKKVIKYLLLSCIIYSAYFLLDYSTPCLVGGIEFQCNISVDSLATIFQKYVFNDSCFISKYSKFEKQGHYTDTPASCFGIILEEDSLLNEVYLDTESVSSRHSLNKQKYSYSYSFSLFLPYEDGKRYIYRGSINRKSRGLLPLSYYMKITDCKSIIFIYSFDKETAGYLSIKRQRECKKIFKSFIHEINQKYDLKIIISDMPTIFGI